MKKILVMIMLLVSPALWAHCPIPFVYNSANLCFGLTWQEGDQMLKGALQSTPQMTPFLNRVSDIPQKWIYSKVLVKIWKSGDTNHVPVTIPNFRVFPYMTMVDGMHHVAAYDITYDQTQNGYVISGFALQEMAGCWGLRWTTDASDDVTTSSAITNVTEYTNLNPADKATAANFCAGGSVGTDMGDMHM